MRTRSALILIALTLLVPRSAMSQPGRVQHLNPAGMRRNPAFTNVVTVTGSVMTVYIGALDPVDSAGTIVGKGDIRAQTEQIFKNLDIALSAAGAKLEHIVIWRIYVTQGQSLQAGYEVFQRVWGQRPNPPPNTVVFVSAQGHPESLISLEAIAVVPR